MEIVKSFALLMVAYGLYGVVSGKIYAKDKWSGRYVYKNEEPTSFWLICASYIGMGAFIFLI
ncbi:hypothetical protein [Pleionea sediminis]|uniref:hypothetical protein n=1 Tax=Pleionea sediminis TaxID=2569479 RepID=UPI001186BA78|nr:hypothetical protein [Pleionea sediminis]